MNKTPNRKYRINSARNWIKTFTGKSIVKGYSKKYSVNKLCAIKELRMIGIEISKEYEKQIISSLEAQRQQRLSLKKKREDEFKKPCEVESDENFAMIMGYTSGGFLYGVTHEEMEQINNEKDFE